MSTAPAVASASCRRISPAKVEGRWKPAAGGMGRGGGRGALLLLAELTLLALSSALNSTCNMHDEFECGNGDCIDFSRTCDGVVHCKDKSDEKQSYCSKVPPLAALLVHTHAHRHPARAVSSTRQRVLGLLGAMDGRLLVSLWCSLSLLPSQDWDQPGFRGSKTFF